MLLGLLSELLGGGQVGLLAYPGRFAPKRGQVSQALVDVESLRRCRWLQSAQLAQLLGASQRLVLFMFEQADPGPLQQQLGVQAWPLSSLG
ncbi:hypothetical protein D3C85_1399610 [compost metagenome]